MNTVSTHGINPTLYGSAMPFDAVRDFAPVGRIISAEIYPRIRDIADDTSLPLDQAVLARVVGGSLIMALGALAIGIGSGLPVGFAAAAMGGAKVGAALVLLSRARRRLAALTAKRQALEMQLAEGAR